jgi:hypothetical protein
MSEALLIGLMTFGGMIISALIGAAGTVEAARQSHRQTARSTVILVGAIFGLIGMFACGFGAYYLTNRMNSVPSQNNTTMVAMASQISVIILETSVPASPVVVPDQTPIVIPSQISVVTPSQVPIQSPDPLPAHTFPQDGSTLALPNGSKWICTGDLFLSRNGQQNPLFSDSDPKIGLLFVVEANDEMTISGPYGGYCEVAPSDEGETSALVEARLSIMKQPNSGNCERGCSAVHVKEIDNTGKIIDKGLR